MQYNSCLYVLLLSFGLSITKEDRCVSVAFPLLILYILSYILSV